FWRSAASNCAASAIFSSESLAYLFCKSFCSVCNLATSSRSSALVLCSLARVEQRLSRSETTALRLLLAMPVFSGTASPHLYMGAQEVKDKPITSNERLNIFFIIGKFRFYSSFKDRYH